MFFEEKQFYSLNYFAKYYTYCGYSAIRISRLLKPDAHLYTLEKYDTTDTAQSIIDHAGLTEKITIINSDLATYINKAEKIEPFDFIFIDHCKSEYLSDFHLMEKHGLIVGGTVIVADNILYPGAPDYKHYLLSSGDKYENVCYKTCLEYTDDIEDEILVSIRKNDIEPPQTQNFNLFNIFSKIWK